MINKGISVENARSFLFVPGDRIDRLQKALESHAHFVIADLEDAVLPKNKVAARDLLLREWSRLDHTARARTMVRINGADTSWHDDDLLVVEQLARAGLPAVMIAKAESVAPMLAVTRRAPVTAILPLIESATGVRAIDVLARVPKVSRLAFGHLDMRQS